MLFLVCGLNKYVLFIHMIEDKDDLFHIWVLKFSFHANITSHEIFILWVKWF